jgi:hypothetical protein
MYINVSITSSDNSRNAFPSIIQEHEYYHFTGNVAQVLSW